MRGEGLKDEFGRGYSLFEKNEWETNAALPASSQILRKHIWGEMQEAGRRNKSNFL